MLFSMTSDQMYERLDVVRRITDAYAAVVPWGGLVLDCPDGAKPVEIDDMAGLVRQLVLHGRGRAHARLAGIDYDLEVPGSDLLDWGNGRGRSQLDAMAGNADAYADFLPRASDPDVRAFLVGLAGFFEMALRLPLSALDPHTDLQSVKWGLDRFRRQCERYRRDIEVAITRTLRNSPCRPSWRQSLKGTNRISEFGPIYRSIRETLGIDHAPLAREAVDIAQKFVDIHVFSRQEVQDVRHEFGLT
jgi:hypothetical protein